MKSWIKRLINQLPYVQALIQQVEGLSQQVDKLNRRTEKLNQRIEKLNQRIETLNQQVKKQGLYPAGHYYSPIPDHDEVIQEIQTRTPLTAELPGIQLNGDNQLRLLKEYAQFYPELPFPEQQSQSCRYYYENTWYSYADAIFLYAFLRKHQPKRMIEVGSGFSSAVILDTVDRFFLHRPEITLIEPYPDRLKKLLRSEDMNSIRIVEKKIQEVPFEQFSSLESGDLVFIDSSHVVKCGSDLHRLLFEILPSLPSGIFVHFHDVFYPFNYPSEWLTEGRFWNENYFLRAFLSYNLEWEIYFFNTYISFVFQDFIQTTMPLCMKNLGGSLYLKKR
jgi:predicted O-methyltransferase YrrM